MAIKVISVIAAFITIVTFFYGLKKCMFKKIKITVLNKIDNCPLNNIAIEGKTTKKPVYVNNRGRAYLPKSCVNNMISLYDINNWKLLTKLILILDEDGTKTIFI